MGRVIGRERELATVVRFLDATNHGCAALVLEGDAGVGKTTVLREAVRLAQDGGFRVIGCRPAQAEAKLAFASVTDLLATVGDDVLKLLPEPQRHALEVALLRRSPSGGVADSRTVGTALLSTMNHLARVSPVVVAIDDVQWLDTASAVVLEFALRRLGNERVGVLTSRRPSEGARLQPGQFMQPTFTVSIGALSLAATHHLLRQHRGLAPSRPLLVRIHRTADGNPLFALEVARLLDAIGEPPAGEPLPVPHDVEALVRGRVAALPRGTREVLVAAAALGKPRVDLLRAAVDHDIEPDLERAEQHSIARPRRGVVTFEHPLFGAALYNSATPAARRRVHRRLAEVVTDPEERARHLALGADGPDEAVADALEQAARHAGARGAPAAAAELMELAVRATLVRDADPRSVELARYLSLAGDFEGSSQLLDELVDRIPEGDLRARALLLLADIEYWTKNAEAACARAEHALSSADDALLRARCHAVIGISSIHDVRRSVLEADSALALLAGTDRSDAGTLSLALCTRARGNLFIGRGLDTADLEGAVAAENGSPPPVVQDRARFKAGQLLKYVDDLDGSRALLEESYRAAVEEGDEGSLVNVLVNLCVTECWAGRWTRAKECADEAGRIAESLGAYPGGAASYGAYVDAHIGNAEAVAAAAARAGSSGEPVVDAFLFRSLGLVELAVGEYGRACEHLEAARALLDGAGFREPVFLRLEGDAVEAALATGDIARAEELLEAFEKHAERVPIPWSLAVSARCRALVDAARGDLESAESAVERALAAHERCPVPFELARTLLAAGQLHRRANRRRSAVDALERAQAIFAELGASPWTERATSELARVPIRRGSGAALTPSERRVAELVAQGRSNQEVAQALFVTKKTVEANLTRIYRKLGVRSRSALIARWSGREAEEEAAKL